MYIPKWCPCLVAFIFLAGCANVPSINRTSRPEALILQEEKQWGTEKILGDKWWGAVLPKGRYIFAWEDKYAWYYEPEEGPIKTKWVGGKNYTEPGAVGLIKKRDSMQLYQYQTTEQLLARGLGDFIIAMLPKRGDRRVSLEARIPDDIKQSFIEEGTVPVSIK